MTRRARHYTSPEEFRQRPRDYDPRMCDEILERISCGEMIGDVCEDRDLPLPGTFLRWVAEEANLAERYEAALRIRAEVNLDEAVSLAFNDDHQKGKVQSDALMRHVERSAPQKYGPKAVIATTTKEDVNGGIDYGMEVRRKLEAMAQRVTMEEKARS